MKFEKIPGIWLGLSSAAYLFGLAALSLWAGREFTVGFGAGGALVLLNSLAACRKLKRTEFTHKGQALASLVGGFYLRLAILGISLFALIRFLKVNAVGLVAGLSVIPAGILIMLILIFVANRTPEEV